MKYFKTIALLFLTSCAVAQPAFTLPATICEQNSVNVSSVNGTVVVTGYTWTASPSGPVISSPNNSSSALTFPNAGSFTITLSTTDGISLFTYTNAITVNPLPTVIAAVNQGTPICPPPSFIGGLNMSGSGATTYTWLPGGQAVQNVNIFPQPSSSTTYTLVGTDANGCIGLTTIFIPVHPLPSISAGGNSPVCPGNTICINASGSATVYSWQGPCGYNSPNQNDCFTAVSGCGGTYNVAGTDGNGCLNVAAVNIVIPEPTLVVTPNPNIICLGQTATLTASGGSSYTWMPGSSMGSSIVITPTTNLDYTVAINNGTCSAVTNYSLVVSPCTGLNPVDEHKFTFKLFPNPANEKIYVDSEIISEGKIELSIADIFGKTILIRKSNLKEGIDISELQSGIYFCEIFIEETRIPQRIKFVKE